MAGRSRRCCSPCRLHGSACTTARCFTAAYYGRYRDAAFVRYETDFLYHAPWNPGLLSPITLTNHAAACDGRYDDDPRFAAAIYRAALDAGVMG
jgi:hypothetical protein